MTHIEIRGLRILTFTHANEFLQKSRLANPPGAKDMKDKEGQVFRAQRGGEYVQLAFAPNEAGMTRLSQMFSKAWRHVPSISDSTS
jgi:hypothetical protein